MPRVMESYLYCRTMHEVDNCTGTRAFRYVCAFRVRAKFSMSSWRECNPTYYNSTFIQNKNKNETKQTQLCSTLCLRVCIAFAAHEYAATATCINRAIYVINENMCCMHNNKSIGTCSLCYSVFCIVCAQIFINICTAGG